MSPAQRPRPFTAGQRRALIAAATLMIACVVVGLVRNRAYVADPLPDEAARADELLDRLDPNVADARQLAALPGLGERRAADLVAYRERLRRDGRIAFRTADDLLRVNGIGLSIARQLEPFLAFPTTSPARQP